MLKLLLIQHLDVTHEEILFMVSDRPDPRCVSGKKPITTMTEESISAMISRRDEYRRRARLRRERTGLQCTALTVLAATAEKLVDRTAALLAARGVSAEAIANLKTQARVAVPRPALRVLEERWDKNDISAEEYQTYQLAIEMQCTFVWPNVSEPGSLWRSAKGRPPIKPPCRTMRSAISGDSCRHLAAGK